MTQSKDTTLHTRQSENSHQIALYCFVFAHLFTCLLIVCIFAVIFWCRCCDKDYFSFQQSFLPFDTAGLFLSTILLTFRHSRSFPFNNPSYLSTQPVFSFQQSFLPFDTAGLLEPSPPRNRNGHRNRNRHWNRTDLGIEMDIGTEIDTGTEQTWE